MCCIASIEEKNVTKITGSLCMPSDLHNDLSRALALQ